MNGEVPSEHCDEEGHSNIRQGETRNLLKLSDEAIFYCNGANRERAMKSHCGYPKKKTCQGETRLIWVNAYQRGNHPWISYENRYHGSALQMCRINNTSTLCCLSHGLNAVI